MKAVLISSNNNEIIINNHYDNFQVKRDETTKYYKYEQNKFYSNHLIKLVRFYPNGDCKMNHKSIKDYLLYSLNTKLFYSSVSKTKEIYTHMKKLEMEKGGVFLRMNWMSNGSSYIH